MINDKKVVGLICECNPFHEGHKRIIKEAKKHGNILIAVMSGNYVQRGEPAVYDKYKRTYDLLKNGADIVVELPIEYVMSGADYFALGAVKILESLKFVDYLIFGSKINDLKCLENYAATIRDNELYTDKTKNDTPLKKYMKEGMSYPKAIENLLHAKLTPNDILAISYINALQKIKSKIIPICIERKDDIKTASELRKDIIKKIDCNSYTDILNYKLTSDKCDIFDKKKSIKDTYLMTDDIYNAIKNADINLTFEERAKKLNTKNRTLSLIKRIFFNIVFGIKKIDKNIKYIRILGAREDAMKYLKFIQVPYLLSYNPLSYKNMIKNFPSNKVVKENKNGEYILSAPMKTNIFADELYYNLIKCDISEFRVKFLKFTK